VTCRTEKASLNRPRHGDVRFPQHFTQPF